MAQPRFQLVPGSRLAGATEGGGVGWRLLGSNNRELGRSASSYTDAESAVAAVARVRLLAGSSGAHIVHDRTRGHWTWHLDDGGTLVATSGRGFRHERECRYNLEQFRDAAPAAPTSPADPPLEFPWQRVAMTAITSESTP